MVTLEVNESVARNQNEALAALFVSNKETRKRIRKIIREELKDAVKRVREDARYAMDNDPRKAYRAVKSMIYRKILGGNISILQRKKAGTRYQLVRDRKLDRNPHQRGGNRRSRSARTEALETYFGADRSFVLRFINAGTVTRTTKYGNRGAIVARNWFANDAPHEMDLAAENLSAVIEEELAEAYAKIDNT
jgi:hypothetical protein